MHNDNKPGDLVRHKTGGPPMTVAKSVVGRGRVRCVWYDSGRPGAQFFRETDLVSVSEAGEVAVDRAAS